MSTVDPDELFTEHALPVIDVRSPSEYQRGHIPGALTVPLFDDAERAEVGTLYKRSGREHYVGRHAASARSLSTAIARSASSAAMAVMSDSTGTRRKEATIALRSLCRSKSG